MESTAMLVGGLILSSIGIGYFIYGRKQDHLLAKYCGLGLMVFPYFASDIYMMLGIGAGLLALPYFLRS